MSTRDTTPNSPLLPDANIVIEAYALSVWGVLIDRWRVVVPSIIVEDEALFYSSIEARVPQPIELKRLVAQGHVDRLEATAEEMERLDSMFDRVVLEGLHPGEREALALLAFRHSSCLFSSSDAIAIKALAMLGHADRGISFERILQRIGQMKPLGIQFTDEFFQRQIRAGQQNRIQGVGMARKGPLR